jgi:hypothetical protein
MLRSHAPKSRSLAVRFAPVFAALGGLMLISTNASADAAGPFAKFLGVWGGAGQITGVNGTAEKIRCHASYATPSDQRSLSQSLTCASDSYRIEIRSFVVAEAQNVQGHWEETTRQVTGHLTGKIADGRFEGSVSGAAFTANLSLSATDRKQTLVITPQGGDISRVSIVLSRED